MDAVRVDASRGERKGDETEPIVLALAVILSRGVPKENVLFS